MRQGLVETVIPIVVGVTVAAVGIGFWQKRSVVPGESPDPAFEANWRSYQVPGSQLASAAARVTVIEFSDFQCPFCAAAARVLDSLRTQYPDLQVTFRHFPLTSRHPHAYAAALASECAGLQDKFENYHDVLFQNQRQIGTLGWRELAVMAQVKDTAAFGRCLDRGQTRARVDQDIAAARELRITGTPLLLVDGKRITTGNTVRIRQIVEGALGSTYR